MEEQELLYTVRGSVAYLTLNRPTRRNALGKGLKRQLADAVARLEADAQVRGVILTGSGTFFSSGTDIADFPDTVEAARQITARSQALFNRLERLPKPVIAALNGPALGGGLELALCCDLRVAAEGARLGFPEVKVPAIPCYGGTHRLTRLIGAGRAKELILTGRTVDAREALAMGAVNRVVPADQVLGAAEALMAEILPNAPLAVAYAKRCVNRGAEARLDQTLELEESLVSMLVPTEDFREGIRAFREKRAPEFHGR